MKFILASNNAHKVEEITAMLGGKIELSTMRDAGLDMEIEENGTTFEENAMIKAMAVWNATKKPSIADDSGLEVDALGGAPGIHSERYAGENADDTERVAKLLNEMQNVPDGQRSARLICCLACVVDEHTSFTVRGICEGVITHIPSGNNGFGYAPIFFVPEKNMTLAQLSSEAANQISNRADGCRKLHQALLERGVIT